MNKAIKLLFVFLIIFPLYSCRDMAVKDMDGEIYFALPKTFEQDEISVSFEYIFWNYSAEEYSGASYRYMGIADSEKMEQIRSKYSDRKIIKNLDDTKNIHYIVVGDFLENMPTAKEKYDLKIFIQVSETEKYEYYCQVSLKYGDNGIIEDTIIPNDNSGIKSIPILFSYTVKYSI